jgi:hypothetical protein
VIHFVVIAGKPESVTRLAGRLMPALERTRYFDGERCTAIGASKMWAAAAISVPDPLCGARLMFDEDAMVAINGPAVAQGVAQRDLSNELLARYKSLGSAGVAAGLGGTYNFVGVAPSTGLRAFVDFSGFFPLYWHAGSDFGVFSNRSTTIASILEPSEWDLRALAWLISHGNLRGEQMPARPAAYLLPGVEAQMRPGRGEVRFETSPCWVWPPRSDDAGRDNLTPDEWDGITADLVANFRSLGTLGRRVRLLLSGGKDSRLCLALAKAAGLQDEILAVTNGPPDGPEVECAAEVARTAGVSHVRLDGDWGASSDQQARQGSWPKLHSLLRRPTRGSSPSLDAELIWRRLRQHVYRYEAIVSPWDGLTDPLHHTTLNIRGHGGALYRRGHELHEREINAADEMIPVMSLGVDPLGVLQADEALFQKEWMNAWAHRTAERVRLDTLPEKWKVDYRLGHWSGPLGQAKPGHINVTPIVSAVAARKNLELSAKVRNSDRLHYEVMRRVAPELVCVPFMNDTWSPQIATDASMDLPRDPFPTTVQPTHRVLASWQYLFLEHQRRQIERLFEEAARKTEMGTICDLEKLKRSVRTAASVRRGPIQMISCVGVAMALLGHAERVVDDCPAQPPIEG